MKLNRLAFQIGDSMKVVNTLPKVYKDALVRGHVAVIRGQLAVLESQDAIKKPDSHRPAVIESL